MSQVFVVTTGQYSEYRIKAILSDNGAAIKLAEQIGGRVQPWAVDTDSEQTYKPAFKIEIDLASGEIYDISQDEGWAVRLVGINERVGESLCNQNYATVESFVSLGHAKKLAVEARQHWLRTKDFLVTDTQE